MDAKLLQAELMLDDKDYGGVVAMMGVLLKGQPDNVQALYLRGKSYFYMDDQSMAKRHFGEALKYDPEHEPAKAAFSKVRKLYKLKAQVRAHRLCENLLGSCGSHQASTRQLVSSGRPELRLSPADITDWRHLVTCCCLACNLFIYHALIRLSTLCVLWRD